jgi:HNH endonuclease
MYQHTRSGVPRGCHMPVLPRLEDQTIKTDDGCWLYKSNPRHIKIGFNGHKEFVHRVAWKIFRGPIPDGLLVLHKCIGHGNCWNPDHLYLGTSKHNAEDRTVQGRAGSHKGELNGRAKLCAEEVDMVRGSDCPARPLAILLGVSLSMIYFIRNGRTWAHV